VQEEEALQEILEMLSYDWPKLLISSSGSSSSSLSSSCSGELLVGELACMSHVRATQK
jgi:hypothetical protein